MRLRGGEYARVIRKPGSVFRIGRPITEQRSFISGYCLRNTSCDQPGGSDGPSSSASLFGLALSGVYQAFPVTRETGALLPHLFTLTLRRRSRTSLKRRYIFCGTFLRVTATPRYGAPCPVEPGLSSRLAASSGKKRAIVRPTPTYPFYSVSLSTLLQ